MAAKRIVSEPENDEEPRGKRMRPATCFASVIGEVMMVRSFQSICNSLEPMIRRVVNEEVERCTKNMETIGRSPSLRIEAPERATLTLIFSYVNLPTIFTCTKINDHNGAPLQVMLVEKCGEQITPKILPHPLKIEIVAIDGDFRGCVDKDVWSADEFNRSIIKERAGRRPLLTKDVNYVMKNNNYVTVGELEFTDNSSWLRSRKFRIGARVVGDTSDGFRVLEALTHPFIVKDHRGELYKKHYPPMLEDDVWRLEKIGKDGKFHKRLKLASIHTVKDFLKLSVVNPIALKTIMGGKSGISEKMWETVLKHAKMCNIGNYIYISRRNNFTLILDAICQIVALKIDGHFHSLQHLTTSAKQEVDEMVKDAHANWHSLLEVDRSVSDTLFQTSPEMRIGRNNQDFEIGCGEITEEHMGLREDQNKKVRFV